MGVGSGTQAGLAWRRRRSDVSCRRAHEAATVDRLGDLTIADVERVMRDNGRAG